MKAEDIVSLRVIETTSGTTIGQVAGLLIDTAEKKVLALGVSSGGVLRRVRYIPFGDIISIENDVVTIPSADVAVDRRDLPSTGILESLTGRQVFTEDGRDLGEVRSYGVDPKSGEIEDITFGVAGSALAGLVKTTGETHTAPRQHIKTLGEHVVLDNSVADTAGISAAA